MKRFWKINALTLVLLSASSLNAQSVEFTLWNWFPEFEKGFWDEAATAFNETKGTNISVQYQMVEFTEMHDKLQSVIGTSNVPDIFTIEFGQWPQYLADGPENYFQPLDAMVEPEKPNLTEAHLQEFVANSSKYAISIQSSPMIMVYRNDIADQVDVSFPIERWQGFGQAYLTLMGSGEHILGIDYYDFMTFLSLFLQRGGQLPASVYDPMSAENANRFNKTAEFLKAFKESSDFEFSVSAFVRGAYDEDIKSGRIMGFVMGDWVIPILKQRFPELEGKWRVQALPTWEEGFQGVAMGGTGYSIVKDDSRSASEAKLLNEFVHFAVYSLKMQSAYYKKFSLQMSNLQLANNRAAILYADTYFGNQKIAADLREGIKDMAPRPVSKNMSEIYAKYGKIFLDYMEGKTQEVRFDL